MADIDPNDEFQRIGLTKVTGGTYTADVTETGVLKVTDSVGQVTTGGQETRMVSDVSSNQLLVGLLKEMQKMNLQLSLLTDTNISNTEVE